MFKTSQMIIYVSTLEIMKTCIKNRFISTQYPLKYMWAGRELTNNIVGLNVRISDV